MICGKKEKELVPLKSTRRILALFLALLFIVSAAPLQAKAENNLTVLTITPGRNFKPKMTDSDYDDNGDLYYYGYLYKLTVPSESLLTVTIKEKDESVQFDIYKDKEFKKFYQAVYGPASSGKEYLGLEKGTYYIRFWDDDVTVKFTLTPEKNINKDNYCAGRARSLKSDTWAEIANTPKRTYTRWYKISVPKRKTVKVSTGPIDGAGYAITMYDAKMRKISVTSSAKYVVTNKKLDKGTYYIRVSNNKNDDNTIDCFNIHHLPYIRLKWR